jgi:hypothetical protein
VLVVKKKMFTQWVATMSENATKFSLAKIGHLGVWGKMVVVFFKGDYSFFV